MVPHRHYITPSPHISRGVRLTGMFKLRIHAEFVAWTLYPINFSHEYSCATRSSLKLLYIIRSYDRIRTKGNWGVQVENSCRIGIQLLA